MLCSSVRAFRNVDISQITHTHQNWPLLCIYITNLVAWIPTHHTCLLPAKLRSTMSLPKTMQRELFCQLLRAKTDSMRQEQAAPANSQTVHKLLTNYLQHCSHLSSSESHQSKAGGGTAYTCPFQREWRENTNSDTRWRAWVTTTGGKGVHDQKSRLNKNG